MQNKVIIIVLVVAVLLVGGIVVSRNSGTNQKDVASNNNTAMEKDKMMADEKMEQDKMMANNEAMANKDSMTKDGDKMMENKDAMMQKSAGTYVDYSESVLSQAQEATKSGRKAVIFFHASWCPNCIAADKAFKSALSGGSFPENITVIKTDYDSQTELKKKYGITGQHTFVQVDGSGNQITKWIGGDVAELSSKTK